MIKISQKKKNEFYYHLKVLVIILIILFNRTNIVYGDNLHWFEISKTADGIQYLDRDSIDIKGKGIIELSTKYLKFDTKNSKRTEENIYKMKINCLTYKFKDISVNGKKNLTAKWEDSNGDKLLEDLISNSCQNA